MKFLVTGAAGFIGYHVVERLCQCGNAVFGIDNLNDYYEVTLKEDRIRELENHKNFRFIKLDVSNRESLFQLFKNEKFDMVIHLAAQAGVRYSLENPYAYSDSNLSGFVNILEGCRSISVKHLIYASSSSVYGANTSQPFKESDRVEHPVSLYAATKRSNDVYNHGEMFRDFTYIDDIVDGISGLLNSIPEQSDQNRNVAHNIFNIGNGQPVKLMDFILALEEELGIKAKKNFLPMQPGDVPSTWASTEYLFEKTGYKPHIDISVGVKNFVSWYKNYYKLQIRK